MWWFLVVIAAVFEVGWATGLKYANDTFTWILTAIAIIISYGILIISSTKLPASTVYAVFVGMGTAGTVAVDMIFFGTALNIGIILFVILLLIGVLGLKSVTDRKLTQKEAGSP
jgi:paired small multidrug resistance pump